MSKDIIDVVTWVVVWLCAGVWIGATIYIFGWLGVHLRSPALPGGLSADTGPQGDV